MKILVISLYYEPDQCQSNGPIVRALCEDWAEAGHEVTVLTSFPHYSRDAVWPEYRGRWFQRDRVGPVRVLRSYIFVPRTRSAFGRILNYLSFNLSSTLAGLATGPQDVVFAMSPPLTIGVTGLLLGLLKRAPFCYNLQDIWPDVAVKLGMLRGRRTIAFFEKLERFIYRRARRLFAISDEFRQNLRSKGVPEEKIVVIPNFTDTEFLQPQPRAATFSQRYELDNKFVVLYAGNLGLSQGLTAILDAAEAIKDWPEILFLLVGQGTCREELVADARRRGLDNVRFLPLLPEAEVPQLYAACDLALIPLRRGIAENSVPCKTYSIMAAGKPYIAGVDEGSNVWKLTAEAGSGCCVPPEDGAALARAVRHLQSNPALAEGMGRSGRAHVERHFAREAITARYRLELESLAAPRAVPLPAYGATKGKTT